MMRRQTTVAVLLLAASLRAALAYDAEDWPTHLRFDDGTDIGIGGNYEGDFNAFGGTSDLSAAQRASLQDTHGARREELSVYIRKPGVYEAQWGWDYWNKSYVDVYARVDSKAFLAGDYGRFRVGYFKTYVGFEGYTRTRNDSFLETALPVSALVAVCMHGPCLTSERARRLSLGRLLQELSSEGVSRAVFDSRRDQLNGDEVGWRHLEAVIRIVDVDP